MSKVPVEHRAGCGMFLVGGYNCTCGAVEAAESGPAEPRPVGADHVYISMVEDGNMRGMVALCFVKRTGAQESMLRHVNAHSDVLLGALRSATSRVNRDALNRVHVTRPDIVGKEDPASIVNVFESRSGDAGRLVVAVGAMGSIYLESKLGHAAVVVAHLADVEDAMEECLKAVGVRKRHIVESSLAEKKDENA